MKLAVSILAMNKKPSDETKEETNESEDNKRVR
jgi:hypothetical protein